MDDLTPRSSWHVSKPTPAPLPPQIDGLIEEGTDALPVRITIVQDGVRTGWDDGAVGFDADAVWFSGRACSFRIVAPDVRSAAYGVSGHEIAHGESSIPLSHPTRRVVVEVAVIARAGHSEWQDYQRVVGGIRRLRACSAGGGESQYPPLITRPGLLEAPQTLRRTQAAFALLAVTGGIFLVWHSDRVNSMVAGFMLFIGLVGYGAPGRHATALRQIEAEETTIPPSALAPPPCP